MHKAKLTDIIQYRSSLPEVFYKKGVFKISPNSQGNTCVEVYDLQLY